MVGVSAVSRALLLCRGSARLPLGKSAFQAPGLAASESHPVARHWVRCMASAGPPPHLILEYDYVPDILDRRGPYREDHLAAANAKLEAGKMLCGGAVGNPPSGALFIFKATTEQEVEEYVKADPYVENGLVTAWRVKPYAVAVGH